MLSSVFANLRSKNCIVESEKSELEYEIPCRDCDAVDIGETGRSLKTRKREHFDQVKKMDIKKYALCQHIVGFGHFIAWDEAKIFKIQANYSNIAQQRVFFINQRASEVDTLKRTNGTNMLVVCGMLMD